LKGRSRQKVANAREPERERLDKKDTRSGSGSEIREKGVLGREAFKGTLSDERLVSSRHALRNRRIVSHAGGTRYQCEEHCESDCRDADRDRNRLDPRVAE